MKTSLAVSLTFVLLLAGPALAAPQRSSDARRNAVVMRQTEKPGYRAKATKPVVAIAPKTVTSIFPAECPANYTEDTFANSACYTTYDPKSVFDSGATYRRPRCEGDVVDDEKRILRAAYSIAPDYAKKKLCNLARHDGQGNDCKDGGARCYQLFVRKPLDTKNSWGLWEAPDTVPAGKQPGAFIAISQAILQQSGSLADTENEVLRNLDLLPSGAVPRDLPSYASADPPDAALGALAALAHELGHVLLADSNADGTEDNHPRKTHGKAGDPTDFCFASDFLGRTWDAAGFRQYMVRWISFKFTKEANHKIRHQPNFKWGQVEHDISRGRYSQATDKLKPLFDAPRKFVSFFAAHRPEEDFVETYKYKVLTDATTPLRTLNLNFPGSGSINIVADVMPSPDIQAKIECLRNLNLVP